MTKFTSMEAASDRIAAQTGGLLLKTLTLGAFVFLLAPIVAIMPIAFSSGTFLSYPIPGVSLRWFNSLWVPYPWLLAVKNSFIIAFLTTLLATTLGTLAAYGVDRLQWRFKPVLVGLLVAPMMMPIVVIAVAIYFVFAQVGLIDSLVGVVLAHTVIAVPLVLVSVTASLKGFDHTLVRAAHSLGATPPRAFVSVVLPNLAPGIVAGAIFAFITSFDEVVIALFLTGPAQITLPRQLFSGLRNQLDPSIVAVAVLLVAFSAVLLLGLEFLRSRMNRKQSGSA